MRDLTMHVPPRGRLDRPWSGWWLSMFRHPTVTRRVQRAGTGHPLTYRDGVCVKLPRGYVFIAVRRKAPHA